MKRESEEDGNEYGDGVYRVPKYKHALKA